MDIGINPVHLLKIAGLPGDLFSTDGATLNTADYFRLWESIEIIAGAEELPLKVGQAISVETFTPPVFASLCSPNMNTALKRLAHYKKLIGPMIFHLDISDKKTDLQIECYGHEGKIPKSLGAMELVFLTQLSRIATRTKIVPLRLELPNLPKNSTPYEKFFGRRIVKGDEVRLVLSHKDATRPFLTEDAGMWQFFEKDLKKKLSDLNNKATTAQRVKSVLLEMLPSGKSTIKEASSRLAMSARTLQRHLKKESYTYQTLLNETRKELAKHYLGKSIIPPDEISYLLGYQDSNSFLRAFKGWTGLTPGQYRDPSLQ